MLDQAILATLNLVRTAKEAVGNAQVNQTINAADRNALISLYWHLEDLEGALILDDIQTQVGKLTADANALTAVTAQLQQNIAELQSVASDVQAAANAIGVLVNIAQSAAALGIVA